MLTTKVKQKVIGEFKTHDSDTGSPEVQVAMLSRRIDELAKHLKKHAGDDHSRRGLIKMVATRRKHLKLLEKTDKKRHTALVKELGL